MKKSNEEDFRRVDAERETERWVMRLDRGLSAEEQDEYFQWLAKDSRHRKIMATCQWGWDELDRLAGLQTTQDAQPDPDLLDPGKQVHRTRRFIKPLFAAIPLAASIVILFISFWPDAVGDRTPFSTKSAVELIARIENRQLEDGSVIELNRGAVVETEYTPEVRQAHLVRGEANFEVAKDADRPFIVRVAGVEVKAVGTQFNVRLTGNTVDVIVSEGVVSLDTAVFRSSKPEETEPPLLEVGHRAIMTFGDEARLDVTVLSKSEMDRELRWQPRLMDFDDVPMREIVAEFNDSNEVQLVLGDESLEEMRLSYSLSSDNVEGFVRLMESSFGLRAEWRNSTEIVLRDARGESSL